MAEQSLGSGTKGGREAGRAGHQRAGGQSCPRGAGGGEAEWRPSREETERERVRELKEGHGGRAGGRRRGSYLLGHLAHGLDAGSIQVAVVLAGLNELVRLDVLLHFLPG